MKQFGKEEDRTLIPITVRTPPELAAQVRAYVSYLRAQVTWDVAYLARVDTQEQADAIRAVAQRNLKTLPPLREIMVRRKGAAAKEHAFSAQLLDHVDLHYLEARKLAEALSWTHDQTSLDASVLAAKKLANVHMAAALLEYEACLHTSPGFGLWLPKWRLTKPEKETVAQPAPTVGEAAE